MKRIDSKTYEIDQGLDLVMDDCGRPYYVIVSTLSGDPQWSAERIEQALGREGYKVWCDTATWHHERDWSTVLVREEGYHENAKAVRVGTRGRIINPDNSPRANLLLGAPVVVKQRLYFPDAVVVEVLDDGPYWKRGQSGELALRYFDPDRKRAMRHNHRAEHLSRRDLGELMLHWHSSQSDPIYAVGSYYVGGKEYPDPSVIVEARDEFKKELSEHERMLKKQPVMVYRQGRQVDLRTFAGYTDRQLKENIAELREILFNLNDLIENADYGHLPNASGHYVWPLSASGAPVSGEGPYGPYPLANAKTTARIRATEGSHDYAVTRGADPAKLSIVSLYQRGTGHNLSR